jgi:hypothetical protein
MESGSLAAGWVSEVVIGFVAGFSVFRVGLQLPANRSEIKPMSSSGASRSFARRVKTRFSCTFSLERNRKIESYEAAEAEASGGGTHPSGVPVIGRMPPNFGTPAACVPAIKFIQKIAY